MTIRNKGKHWSDKTEQMLACATTVHLRTLIQENVAMGLRITEQGLGIKIAQAEEERKRKSKLHNVR